MYLDHDEQADDVGAVEQVVLDVLQDQRQRAPEYPAWLHIR
jgi:hypothetical protein